MCLSVLYRNPKCWMDRDEIWHGGGPCFFDSVPPPPVMGCIKGVLGASAVSFGKNFIKQKLKGALI